ncbi:MAG: hypothetical protein IJ846_07445 [Alphaproteobacteria bacterium]|nr:hypothetical protein [Alphaproteobacteria bacterium]
MKKTLCLTAVMLSVFAFSGTANALQADVMSSELNTIRNFEQQQYLIDDVVAYEGGTGGGTIVGNSCASTCGGASTQSACQAGGYVCRSSGGCWCPTGTPLGSGTLIDRDLSDTVLVDRLDRLDRFDGDIAAADIGSIVDGGSGSGTTKKVSGNCPEGTSLSSDKCCCVAN